MNNYFSFIILFVACLMLILCAVSLFRAKDIFVMLQPIKIFSFYGFPLVLVAFLIENFTLALLIKISSLACLEIVFMAVLIQVLLQKTTKQKISPDGKEISLIKKKR